ncbi:ATP-binding cassette domain-containing protein [Amphritea sp. 2_MG-2023]|uniref:ATP-binding cassette domain-containing protein n=1 Tax=Amphritea TaxID=515417 RepID=UPI001C079693|nr:ATP-binding cassette domain-containing protein [Amphritea sp. 2_MG-2023]MBU2964143.1 ATP-binding cassette domain-containing protein [Amphritea atlantica]MDO6418542.1 ATP-binding cassette domain-containing protein [Amphritea sp. 2_MG-2023]
MSSAALKFSAVSKTFTDGRQVSALDDVSFSIQPGRVTGLIGPDGAGKTTLIRLAAGLLLPDAGDIRVLDIDALAEPLRVQSSISYMPQRFGLYEDLSVQENLDLYADLQGLPVLERPARYAELMQMTGLSPFAQRLAGQLSGGMKQKLGLACTLVRSPRLLLLDEPTVGVDPVSRRELWQIVYRQVQEAGMTVLLSTAYLDEAERCDEVILLHQGKLLDQGEPAKFSRSVAGRTFRVSTQTLSHRRLQEALSRAPGVLDALIEGETVRLVMETAQPPTAERLLPGQTDINISAVEPRFEDAFIARLKVRRTDAPQVEFTPPSKIDAAAGDEVIRVDKLQRRFGDFIAVNNVSFSVRRGEIFGLLGANGAGKSTTFRMLCGLLPVSSGELAVAGYDLRRAAATARGRIGYMAQKFSLYSNLSVRQNLQFFSSAYGLRGKQQKARLDWALTTFELAAFQNANAGDLPLGYKQRLSFAAALMHEPDILFLDEPTSGVDPLARREFWARTNALAEAGVTVLVTTHFMEEANYCDRLVIMADGEVLAAGTPLDMKMQARTVDNPDPTMEDAFIQLIEQRQQSSEVEA